jgi:hypothetical protein
LQTCGIQTLSIVRRRIPLPSRETLLDLSNRNACSNGRARKFIQASCRRQSTGHILLPVSGRELHSLQCSHNPQRSDVSTRRLYIERALVRDMAPVK